MSKKQRRQTPRTNHGQMKNTKPIKEKLTDPDEKEARYLKLRTRDR
jgi:hypothetical protein